MDGIYVISFIIGVLIWALIWGFVTKHISESKGYYGGFWWGFWLGWIGLIVVACKPQNLSYRQSNYNNYTNNNDSLSPSYDERESRQIIENGGWKCPKCNRINSYYVTTCLCGEPKPKGQTKNHENISAKNQENFSVADELIKLKKLLDEGVLTQEEFDAKKKRLLQKL